MLDRSTHREGAHHPDRGFRIFAQILDDAARREVEGAFVDSVTHLPTLQLLLTQIRATLAERNQVGLVTVIVNPYVRLEELFGWETYERVLQTVAGVLQTLKDEQLRDDDSLAELSMSGSSFVLVLSPPRYNSTLGRDDLVRLQERIQQRLQERLTQEFPAELASTFTCSIGSSIIVPESGVPVERLVLRALDQAYSDAFRERDQELSARATKLTRIIERGDVSIVFQPVVDVHEGQVLGYEAYTRGPRGEFEDAAYLFKLATETKLLWKLERASREEALARAAKLPEGALLFLNMDLESVFDPDLKRSEALREAAGRVVIEINERAAAGDYALFRRALAVIQELGLRVAIDDVSSAFSGLRLIAEVEPAFIKLDMAITGNVRESVVKRDLVRTVARIADKLNTPLIVEGVESSEQLEALLDLGIRYAEGFLFGPPQAEFAAVDLSPFAGLIRRRRSGARA